jgi:hypothetical protein
VTGWYRTIEYLDDKALPRWWVEVYDFDRDDGCTHRVWRSLADPTSLATSPDLEYDSVARPRYAVFGLQPDGLPTSPLIANAGRVLGLYATELRLSAVEEFASFPMLKTRGPADFDQIGPAGPRLTAGLDQLVAQGHLITLTARRGKSAIPCYWPAKGSGD